MCISSEISNRSKTIYICLMKTLLLICLSLATTTIFAQQTINGTIVHDGLQRTYILDVPANYTAGTPVPLILNFHGYGSNAGQQQFYGDFRAIADTAGFIIVHPQGTLDPQNTTYWNAAWGGTVDDVSFTAALIDSLSAQYSIDQDRVYSTGMSNGGFMSYYLACNLSDRIAAIASVTGTMTQGTIGICSPEHPMPVMEIHGTADLTVPYIGQVGMEPVASVLSYWSNFNNCNATPILTNVPNTVLTDGCTAENQLYINGDNGVDVEHYKIINGAHTWPGAPVVIGVTNYDFDASTEIWRFFSQFDINGRINPVGITEKTKNDAKQKLNIFPNPAQDVVTINWKNPTVISLRIVNTLGAEIMTINGKGATNTTISLATFNTGIYFVEARNENGNRITATMVVSPSLNH